MRLPSHVSGQEGARQATYSQTRSAGQSLLTSLARLALEERGQDHDGRVLGVGGRAGWGDGAWGHSPMDSESSSRVSAPSLMLGSVTALPRGTMLWLRP